MKTELFPSTQTSPCYQGRFTRIKGVARIACVMASLIGITAAAPAVVSVVENGVFSSQIPVGGKPALAYSSGGNLKFARNAAADGSGAWTSVTVDAAGGGYPSLAMVSSRPAIAYWKAGHLYFARASSADGSGPWTSVLVDGAAWVGLVPSLVVVSGTPAISYYDSTNSDLKYARSSAADGSGGWSVSTVDSAGWVGAYTSMAVVDGRPAIAYTDLTGSPDYDLKYARSTSASGSGWIITTVHSAGSAGEAPSLVVVDGFPAIAYKDNTTPAVAYARNSSADGSGSWSITTAAAGGGLPGSLAIVNNRPAISYSVGGNVNYVRANDAAGASWGPPLTVDTRTMGMDWYVPLAMAGGRPSVSYSDHTTGQLRWARIGPLPGDADDLDAAVVGDYVFATAVQSDGKTIIAGKFSSILGVPRTNIARLNADGTLDLGFNPVLTGYDISCLAVQADGKIVVGGNMTLSHLVRLNTDGTLDPGFAHGPGNAPVCLAIQPDGKILVGGYFGHIDGFARAHVARFNADGSHDHGFIAGTDLPVFSLTVQTDGKILIGGQFNNVNGVAREKLARVNPDGSLDTDFNPGVTGSYITTVMVQADDRILLGGVFSAVAGSPRSNIARLQAGSAGTVDASFDPAADGAVHCAALQANGDILIGGAFSTVHSSGGGPAVARSRIARIHAGGSLDPSFNPGANSDVYCMGESEDGRIFVGGTFTTMDGLSRARFARLVNDPATQSLSTPGLDRVEWLRGGSSPEAQHVAFELSTDSGASYLPLGLGVRIPGGWSLTGLSLPREGLVRARARTLGGYGSGSTGVVEASASYRSPVEDLDLGIAGGIVLATAEQADGKTVIAGNFTSVLGVTRNNVARINADGTLDLTFDPNPNNVVRSIAMQADGKILLGGNFTTLQPNGAASPTARLRIARVNGDGTLDTGFHPDVDALVWAMAIQADGEVVLTGDFTSVAGVTRHRVARLHVDGSLDTGFDPSADYLVNIVIAQPDGRILLGGEFTTLQPNGAASPTTRRGIARVNPDGSLDALFDPTAGVSSHKAYCMAQQPDGRLLLSGLWFGPGYAGWYVKRLNADATGTVDPTFTYPATTDVHSMALQADGKILIKGGAISSFLQRINTDGGLDPGFVPIECTGISTLALQADGKILVGGAFTSVGGVPRNGFARLENNPAPQSLTVPSPGRVEWLRGGTSPESLDVTFELSTDGGSSYALLGPGTRISGGWEITGLSLPSYGQIRARARTISGFSNGSSGLVDAITTFGTPPGGADDLDLAIAGLRVWAMAVQPDGKTVISGEFTSVLGVPRNNIARINPDGSLDLTFNPNITGGPGAYAVAVQQDGKIVIGGYFTHVGGVFRLCLARLNPDGSLDSTYDPHPENPVYCMAMQPDGKLLIGGAFSTVGGAARVHLARLEVSGIADPAFVAPAPNNYVTSLALQPDGDVLFGGYFTSVGASTRNHLARVTSSGSLDAAFDPDVTGTDLYALAVQADGKILLGGTFSAVGSEARSHLARVHSDGSPDLAFDPKPNNIIYGLTVQSDGRILASGGFSTLHPGGAGPAIVRHNIARLTPGGTVDLSFDPDPNGFVNGTAIQEDGSILLGGEFTHVGPSPRNLFARLLNDPATQSLSNYDRTRIQWLRGGSSPESHAVSFELSTDGGASYSPLGQGTRIAGGWELTGLSLPDSGLIRARARTTGGLWNGTGGLVETVASIRATLDPLDPSIIGGRVNASAMQPDGGVIIAGQFTSVLGVPRRNVARIKADGTLDMTFDPSPNAIVNCVAIQADGKILLGGNFNEIQPNGSPTPEVMANLVRLNPDGTADYTFLVGGLPPNPNAHVNCLAVQPDGKILVGGSFSYISGEVRLALARLNVDGTPDAFDAAVLGSTLIEVVCLALQPDGRIVIGGYFNSVGGQPRNGLARVEADGSLDSAFNPIPDGYVLSLALQRDGGILVGGQFTIMNSTGRRNLARLHATGLLDTTFKPEPNDSVWTLAVQADGKILLGGSFTTLRPDGALPAIARHRLARLRTNGSLDPDFPNPVVNAEVLSLACGEDGRLWTGGTFTTVDGIARVSLALLSTGPATNTLSKPSATSLDWRRGGTSPEASDVTFELSGDGGLTYTLLGHGSRIAGGWTLTGLSLPASGLIRARARTAGGFFGGSSGLVETILDLSLPIVVPFDEWVAGFMPFASAASRTFTADPDRDGLQNGLEYYFGLHPSAASNNPLQQTTDTNGITLTFARANGLGALDATAVRWSTDLENWSHSGVVTTVTGPAGTQHETVSAFVPAATGGRLFVVVGVEE